MARCSGVFPSLNTFVKIFSSGSQVRLVRTYPIGRVEASLGGAFRRMEEHVDETGRARGGSPMPAHRSSVQAQSLGLDEAMTYRGVWLALSRALIWCGSTG